MNLRGLRRTIAWAICLIGGYALLPTAAMSGVIGLGTYGGAWGSYANVSANQTDSLGNQLNYAQQNGGQNYTNADAIINTFPSNSPPYVCSPTCPPMSDVEAYANQSFGHLGAYMYAQGNGSGSSTDNNANAHMFTTFQVTTPAGSQGQYFAFNPTGSLVGTVDGSQGSVGVQMTAVMYPTLIPAIFGGQSSFTDPPQMADWRRIVDPTGTYYSTFSGVTASSSYEGSQISSSPTLDVNMPFSIPAGGIDYLNAGLSGPSLQQSLSGEWLPGAASSQTWDLTLYTNLGLAGFAQNDGAVYADFLHSLDTQVSYSPQLQVTALSGSYPGVNGTVPASVPAPPTSALFALGLLPLGWLHRRAKGHRLRLSCL